MRTPGITVRRLILMDGAHEVNEVFFDDVEVPAENLVFEEGKGWTVAKYLLGYERMNTGRIGESKRQLAYLKRYGEHLMGDARWRDRLSRLEVELTALEVTNLRFLDRMRRTGEPPGADVSMLKIRGTEIQQGLTELMMDAADPVATGPLADRPRPSSARSALAGSRTRPIRLRLPFASGISACARPRSTPARTRSSATSS